MFKKIMNKKMLKNEKGLTLVELLAVVVIMAIVAAIAIPAIGNIIDNSRDKAIISEGLNIIAGAKIAKMDGVCDGTNTKPCNDGALKDKYVEGITKGKTAAATYTAIYSEATTTGANPTAGGWTLNFSKFADIKAGSEYKVNDGVSESDLKATIDKK